MRTTRRGFLGAGAVGIAGSVVSGACGTPSMPAHQMSSMTKKRFVMPTNAPVRVRKSVWDLSDAELQTLCKAVAYMRNEYLVSDNRKWENYAKIHAWHCTGEAGADPHGVLQVHWSWHFLPWHRGYIYFLERILAQALKDQHLDDTTFAYPFWDWTVHQEMPNTKTRAAKGLASPLWGYDLTQENMVNADTLGFDNLALFNGNRGPSLTKSTMSPDNEMTADSKAHIREAMAYLSAPYINLALTLPWEEFGGKIDIARTSQGILEAGPHNDGHDWCGTRFGSNRDMGTLKFAAQDPIFFMHHGNIDRIFSLYPGQMPDLDGPWGQQTYDYTDADGSTVTVSVKEIMTTMTAAVKYAVPSDNALVVPTRTRSAGTPRAFAVGSAAARFGQATAQQPLTITVAAPPATAPTGVYVMTIETSPLHRRGRARIDITSGSTKLGRIKLLDGDTPASTAFQSHTFRIMLTSVPNATAFPVTFTPTGFDGVVEIRSVELTRFE